jgi:nucleotide-binding universal stress UspA family protein
MMTARILCAVDLTPLAPHVVALASAFARAKGASVTLLYATNRRDPRPEAAEQLERLAVPLRGAGIPVSIAMEESEPAPFVLECARGAALVVMGTHGGHGVERLMLGSVAEQVLDHAPCPVATVREAFQGVISRIVCGVDLVDAAPLEAALALAHEMQAEVIVLHSAREVPEEGRHSLVPASYCPALLAEERERLHAALAVLDTTGIRIREAVAPGRPYRQLIRCATEESAGLIVVGVHPHLFGGTAHHVVREAECPVLTVRGAAASEESSR